MMVGLHGSGKTTTSAKLAALLRKQGMRPALVACDVYRPAAIDQLEILGRQIGVPVYSDRNSRDDPEIGERLGKLALQNGANAVIFDTAGRLQIDAGLIEEIKRLRGGGFAQRSAARCGRGAGAGGCQRGEGVQRGGRCDGGRDDEARRRCARGRRALNKGGFGGAYKICGHGREDFRHRGVPRRPAWRSVYSAWATS